MGLGRTEGRGAASGWEAVTAGRADAAPAGMGRGCTRLVGMHMNPPTAARRAAAPPWAGGRHVVDGRVEDVLADLCREAAPGGGGLRTHQNT